MKGEEDTRAADRRCPTLNNPFDERARERVGHEAVHPEERGEADQQGGRLPTAPDSRSPTGL